MVVLCYSFKLPTNPFTKYFCKAINTRTTGNVDMSTAIIAMFGVICALCVTSADSAIGSTRKSIVVVETSGQMYMFQAVKKVTDT